MSPLFSQETIEEAKKRIMNYSEYTKLGNLKFPDHFYVQGKGKEILFYQAQHSHDPNHTEFQEIPKLMQEFKPDKVFVEMQGWVNNSNAFLARKEEVLTTDLNEIISRNSEPGFTIRTAIDSGLSWNDIISPELSHQHLGQYLEQYGYTRDEIFFFYVIRNLGTRFYEAMSSINDQELIGNCTRFGNILNIPEHESVDLFKTLHRKLLGKDFENDKDHKNYHDITAPLPRSNGTFDYFSKMSNIASRFRDETILEKVANVLEQNNKLMIVYGASHGVVLKPALEYLLSK